MKVTKTSLFTGRDNTLEINITPEQLKRWQLGELIQEVAPHLTPDEREFLISGCTPEEWGKLFGEEEGLSV